MDKKIARWMEKKCVPGLAACIVKGDRIVWSKGYGMANLAKNIPFTPDRTLFQIASISKTFTATAIMQLRDSGMFDLADDVNRFLKFPVRNPRHPDRALTFKHLLTHSSSIAEGEVLYSLYAVGDPTTSLKDVVTQYFTPDGSLWSRKNFKKHAPGEKQVYSNAGFALLGYLVEVISKKPLEDYLQENVFSVLKMNETSFYISKLDRDRQACAYTFEDEDVDYLCEGDGDGNLLPEGVSPSIGYNEHALYSYPSLADGMVRTSVNQLAHFMIAMMNGGRFEDNQLLKDDTVKEMLTYEKIGKKSDDEVGLCWLRDGNFWGHDGSDPGCTTAMKFNPASKIGFIVFANAEADLDRVEEFLMEAARTDAMIS
jgi:CubicO group peptidase (beta-lactamase class C family)